MKKYTTPEVAIIKISEEDIIVTSADPYAFNPLYEERED